jgi:hypothetical protein
VNLTDSQSSTGKSELTPEKVVEILAKHGTTITADEAGKVLDFLTYWPI